MSEQSTTTTHFHGAQLEAILSPLGVWVRVPGNSATHSQNIGPLGSLKPHLRMTPQLTLSRQFRECSFFSFLQEAAFHPQPNLPPLPSSAPSLNDSITLLRPPFEVLCLLASQAREKDNHERGILE